MHPRISPLTLAVLLTATGLSASGCVSVPAAPRPPVPGVAPADVPSPSPADREHRAEQAPARGELAPTGTEKPARPRLAGVDEAGTGRAGEAPGPAQGATPRMREGRAAASQQRVRERRDPPPAAGSVPPRKDGRHPAVRSPRPRTDYGMSDLCRFSDGVANPSLVAMCRANYGR
ncbi:hypothetical protein SSP531S_36960 [Streptomyces spongiicola]|uniref:Lipoprotein n=1 Tax=Streptomyces spongiicola TaxID=1690221 RepID=A0A388T0E0_9ACTN|nr:hypothetical protein [Streptomyces spongiicola]GBQ02239.1 hypothetical protein SSP531S_36960 [Streptomyces spongiicola]